MGREQGNRVGDTDNEDLQSPQSRRKIAAVNENAENPTQGPDPYRCEGSAESRSGPGSLPRTSRAAVQRRKRLRRICTGGKEKKFEGGEGDNAGPQGTGKTQSRRGVKANQTVSRWTIKVAGEKDRGKQS